ncbi:MAG: MFS transporter, partial [Methyloceanibacter sp.]
MKRQTDEAPPLASAIRKATVRLIPFLCLAYTVNFLDRVNVGFAALHMNEDLGFSPAVYGFGAGIFFLGYIRFEIPSNLALRRFGARISVPLATVFGGPLSGALLEMHGFLGFAGWQWLFVIEGLPAIILGILALKVLTDEPSHAAWLTDEEKTALSGALAREAKETESVGYADLRTALTRPRVLALGGLYFLMVTGLYGIGFW